MRIGVNTRVLLRGRMEGVCRYIHETTKQMVLAHPEDDFIFFFDREFHPGFIYASNVTPVVLAPPARDPILWKIWFEYSIPRALKKYKIDVFLSGDSYTSLKTKVPTVLVSHDIAYTHFPDHLPSRILKYYQKNFPKFHERADHIIAVSEFTKSDIIEKYGIAKEKITVAHNALPPGFQTISDSEKQLVRNRYTHGDPFFIYLGSIHPRKNVKTIIKGFEKFKSRKSPYKLVLLGRKAWKFEEIERQIQNSEFKKDIIYLDGHINDPLEILPAAEAMCYISLLEGFGIPLLEAMACEVPVICSNVSSLPEVAGDAAIQISPMDAAGLAEAMKSISDDQSLRINLINKGRKRLKDFSWKASSEKIFNAINQIYT